MAVDHTVTGSKFQFCTEAVLRLKEGNTKEELQAAFEKFCGDGHGDSLAVVGAPVKAEGGVMMAKAHFHTNDLATGFMVAGEFLAEPPEGKPLGWLEREKVWTRRTIWFFDGC